MFISGSIVLFRRHSPTPSPTGEGFLFLPNVLFRLLRAQAHKIHLLQREKASCPLPSNLREKLPDLPHSPIVEGKGHSGKCNKKRLHFYLFRINLQPFLFCCFFSLLYFPACAEFFGFTTKLFCELIRDLYVFISGKLNNKVISAHISVV